jgi:hypothetical protein
MQSQNRTESAISVQKHRNSKHIIFYDRKKIKYNVDKEKGLIGEPDYLIARTNKYGGMATPVLCVIEAKKDKLWNSNYRSILAIWKIRQRCFYH